MYERCMKKLLFINNQSPTSMKTQPAQSAWKRALKFIFKALFLFILMYKASDLAYNKNKFRFESFKSYGPFTGDYDKDNAVKMKPVIDYLKDRFPVGNPIEPLLQKLEEGGAECGSVRSEYYEDYKINNHPPQNATRAWFCEYFTGVFTLDWSVYRVVVDVDKNDNILSIEGFKLRPM